VVDRLLDRIVLANRAVHFVVEAGVKRERGIHDRVLGAHGREQRSRERLKLFARGVAIAASERGVNLVKRRIDLHVPRGEHFEDRHASADSNPRTRPHDVRR